MATKLHSITVLAGALMLASFAYSFDYSAEYAEETASKDTLPRVTDLSVDAATSRRLRIPIMIEFSTTWCEYCRALEEEVLAPMLISGDYDDSVILRKLVVDDGVEVRDFDGSKVSSSELGQRADVGLYPTIVFFDADGNEISERIVGVTSLDYVSLYIDEALELATSQLQQPVRNQP